MEIRKKAEQIFGIGSWIKHPELEYYCDEDDFSNGYAQITSMSRDELNTTSLKEISYDKVEPIQLTSEFLEKLGFKKDGYTNLSPDYFYEDEKLSITINLNKSCNKEVGIWIHTKELPKQTAELSWDRTNPGYVGSQYLYLNQLQSLLNLVGFELKLEDL